MDRTKASNRMLAYKNRHRFTMAFVYGIAVSLLVGGCAEESSPQRIQNPKKKPAVTKVKKKEKKAPQTHVECLKESGMDGVEMIDPGFVRAFDPKTGFIIRIRTFKTKASAIENGNLMTDLERYRNGRVLAFFPTTVSEDARTAALICLRNVPPTKATAITE